MTTTLTTNYGFDKPAIGDTGWGGIRNQNMDDLDAELFKPRIGQAALSWGPTTTVDLSLARVFTGTNNQVSTIAFSNVPNSFPNGAAIPVVTCDLIITNGGAFAITWPASVTWLAGTAPVLKASGVNHIRLLTRDGGTTWYGAHLRADSHRVLDQAAALSTSATSEATLRSFTVPANALRTNGQTLRLTIGGRVNGAGTGTFRIYWGGVQVYTVTITGGGGGVDNEFMVSFLITRSAAGAQKLFAHITQGTGVTDVVFANATADETTALALEYRALVSVGTTSIALESTNIEYLAA